MRSTWGDRDAGRWIDETTGLFVGEAAEAYLAAERAAAGRAAGVGVRARRRPPRRAHRGARAAGARRRAGAGRQRACASIGAPIGVIAASYPDGVFVLVAPQLQPARGARARPGAAHDGRLARPRQSGSDRRRPRHRQHRRRHRAARPHRARRRRAAAAQGGDVGRRQPRHRGRSVGRTEQGKSSCRVSRCRLSLLAVGCARCPQAAGAGAWTLPEGHGQVVVTGTASRPTKAFDGSGSLQSTPRYNKNELQALIEYGVTDWLTAIGVPGLQHVDIAAPVDAQRTGFGNTEFGARVRVMQAEQLGAVRAGHRPRARHLRHRQSGRGRLHRLRGRSARAVRRAASRSAACRHSSTSSSRSASAPAARRAKRALDLTLRLRAAPQWLVLLQQFNVVSEGAGRAPFPSNNYHKLQFSVVYDLTPQWSVQGGAFTTFAGRNALQENGLAHRRLVSVLVRAVRPPAAQNRRAPPACPAR